MKLKDRLTVHPGEMYGLRSDCESLRYQKNEALEKVRVRYSVNQALGDGQSEGISRVMSRIAGIGSG